MNSAIGQPSLLQWDKVLNIVGHQNSVGPARCFEMRFIIHAAQPELVCGLDVNPMLSKRGCQCVSLTVLVQLNPNAAHSEEWAGSAFLLGSPSELIRSSVSISPVISSRFAKAY